MGKITQKVVYEVDGKSYPDFVSAEAALVDCLGEEIDGLFKTIDTGNMRYTEHSKMLIQLVERLWENRDKIAPLLALEYVPSSYIQEQVENFAFEE